MADENAEVLPGSRRPDGTYRKPVRVKKGYVPPEEQEKFRPVDTTPVGVVGAEPIEEVKPKPATQAAKKNEKRKEKKKVEGGADTPAAAGMIGVEGVLVLIGVVGVLAVMGMVGVLVEWRYTRVWMGLWMDSTPAVANAPSAEKHGEPSEVEKKVKALKKKLRQIDDLEEKKAAGATMNAEQNAKIAARADIDAEIAKWESLGEIDVGKKVKALKKKLRQIEELEEKKAAGVELNADQQGKVQAKPELVDEIKLLESLVVS
ncbi:hypothetical protein AB1Y20_016463 [Prymnesium parvum]|uniref:WIBG Mago-binding domain-containing protein n=1 Tax=Prymnesium parvum TaxID=97485 RepID=A0AB34IFY5_PRYPA